MPKDLRSDQARETLWKSVLEVQRRFPDGIPILDPIENMGIKDEKFKVLVKVNFSPCSLSFPHRLKLNAIENRSHGTKNVFQPTA